MRSFYDIDFHRVGVRYRLKSRIGAGSFGDVYLAIDIVTKQDVAIKLERIIWTNFSTIGHYQPYRTQLENEWHICQILNHCAHIPRVHWFGAEGDYDVMVFDLLGPSLQDIFLRQFKRKFSLKTVLLLALEMISQMDDIHSHGVIHRDIKPDHFLVGLGINSNKISLIDFGVANEFRDPATRAHIKSQTHLNLIGTAQYCSINAHLGMEQSRRDDMESLAYVLIYFLRGSLPWQSSRFTRSHKQNYRLMMEKKVSMPTSKLCKGLPLEFGIFLDYSRGLSFDAKPDYCYLRSLFNDLYIEKGYCSEDAIFDWVDDGQGSLEARDVASGAAEV